MRRTNRASRCAISVQSLAHAACVFAFQRWDRGRLGRLRNERRGTSRDARQPSGRRKRRRRAGERRWGRWRLRWGQRRGRDRATSHQYGRRTDSPHGGCQPRRVFARNDDGRPDDMSRGCASAHVRRLRLLANSPGKPGMEHLRLCGRCGECGGDRGDGDRHGRSGHHHGDAWTAREDLSPLGARSQRAGRRLLRWSDHPGHGERGRDGRGLSPDLHRPGDGLPVQCARVPRRGRTSGQELEGLPRQHGLCGYKQPKLRARVGLLLVLERRLTPLAEHSDDRQLSGHRPRELGRPGQHGSAAVHVAQRRLRGDHGYAERHEGERQGFEHWPDRGRQHGCRGDGPRRDADLDAQFRRRRRAGRRRRKRFRAVRSSRPALRCRS